MTRAPRHHVFLPADLVARIDTVRASRCEVGGPTLDGVPVGAVVIRPSGPDWPPTMARIRDAHEACERQGRRPNTLEISRADSLRLREECRRDPTYDAHMMLARGLGAAPLDPMQDADGRDFAGMRIRVREGEIVASYSPPESDADRDAPSARCSTGRRRNSGRCQRRRTVADLPDE